MAEGTALAQALLDKLANGYISAEGTGPGNPKIKSGVMVDVKGVGSSFSGSYRVATSTHLLRGGGAYVTTFANAPSHTILGAIGNGGPPAPDFSAQLVLGIVTNNNDPEDLGRVRVQYPALELRDRGRLGADRDRERGQGARAADAPGRRRGGARRLRARRHDPALRARLAVQRLRHAGRRPAARQGRLVRRAERQAHPDAGEGDVHDQGRRRPHDRDRRQGRGEGQGRLDPRRDRQDRDQVHAGDEPRGAERRA